MSALLGVTSNTFFLQSEFTITPIMRSGYGNFNLGVVNP